ncbi:DNA mismatch repair protein MutS [Flexibacter flexilis DSM 6793]|uniref:DNA mismatch repair protein MutS n=1 Tax=Flexibacter flexilis DSM 6793 TaxID=927664 RepID=A0A1I1LNN1_9BACT|nr:DNA mismatch repair protein MutS [Flexibacter flexilis]SFC74649.1 DNA mismatch repair protein MutS [Flexibacter flexilis DSM 6793]
MTKVKEAKETPLMKQYNAIKAKHPGALLLFRVGDFYETFGDDAVTASKILNITLTKRANGAASEMALAGFPHHSLDTYLPKLVRAGQRVAICDQLEDPKDAVGIVKRGVTELVTPGITLNDNVLETKQNNFLAAIHLQKNGAVGVSFMDISTGEFYVAQGDADYCEKLLQSFMPSEVLFCKPRRVEFEQHFGNQYNTYTLEDWIFQPDYARESLTRHFNTATLKGFGVEEMDAGIIAAGAVLHYLAETEHRELGHVSALSRIEEERYVWLDKFTIRNLELVFPQQENGVPLIEILDHTVTPMGGRLLRKWTLLPLKEKNRIDERLQAVEAFVQDSDLRQTMLQHLKPIGDLERLISKVAVRRINPREMLQLKKALKNILPIKDLLAQSPVNQLKKLADQLNPCSFLYEKIERELQEELPIVSNQGGMFREGVDTALDELREISHSGKDYLLQVQNREIQRTGISSLKVSYNKVFGYYLEVSNANKDKVPADWIRKQTLTNAERYITEELKTYEEKILTAEEKITAIEQRLFNELVLAAADFVGAIQQNAKTLAVLDSLISFATVATRQNYVKPNVTEDNVLDIKDGRHPVIETQLPVGEPYIPNDVFLDDASQQIIIITGPNMAGKSALLRQTALIVLMAQMGSYVPATAAHVGMVDKVFTRVGASDNLSRGESTFMVEMTETASILNNLSPKSLVLMDEIGRGTSTYDGVAIAWSIVEYLHTHTKCKARTLFATHYHELNELAADFPRIKNFNVSVKESGNKVIFMRKLQAGGSAHSFGIHVAQMAGMPNAVVLRANEIMHHLEKDNRREQQQEKVRDIPKNNYQLSIFQAADPQMEQVAETLRQIDVNTLSPVEALLKLNELKLILAKKS